MALELVEGNKPTWMIDKQAAKEKINNRYLERTEMKLIPLWNIWKLWWEKRYKNRPKWIYVTSVYRLYSVGVTVLPLQRWCSIINLDQTFLHGFSLRDYSWWLLGFIAPREYQTTLWTTEWQSVKMHLIGRDRSRLSYTGLIHSRLYKMADIL